MVAKNKKCIVLTVSRNFMSDHPRAGQPTGFPELIKMLMPLLIVGNVSDFDLTKGNGSIIQVDAPATVEYIECKTSDKRKLHTIRAGDYWRKVVDKVNTGSHYLSVRTWNGRPYVDKGQTEIAQFHQLGYQHIEIDVTGRKPVVTIDGVERISSILTSIAENDGLNRDDFNAWFGIAYGYQKPDGQWVTAYRKKPYKFSGGIIHFTDLRY